MKRESRVAVLSILIFFFSTLHVLGQLQVVTPEPTVLTPGAGTEFEFDLKYSTNPEVQGLSGLGIRLHYDSSKLDFAGLSNILQTGLVAQGVPESDTADWDDDADTNTFVTIAWANVQADWPGGQLPIRLLTSTFGLPKALSSDTSINFSSVSVAAGYSLASQSVTIEAESASYFVYFPHLANGGGLSSTFVLVNPSTEEEAGGFVEMYDQAGNPLTMNINGTPRSGSLDFKLPPRGVAFFRTDGLGAVQVGSAKLSANLPVGGTILFSAGLFGVAGVAATQPARRFLVPVQQDDSASVSSGVALQNPSNIKVSATLILADELGEEIDSRTVELPAKGQIAMFTREFFPQPPVSLSDFQGSLVVESPVPICGLGIQVTSPTSQSSGHYATLPVVPLEEPPGE